MRQVLFALVVFPLLLVAGCAAPQLSSEELREAWRQAEYERGKLRVGRVLEVKRIDRYSEPEKLDSARAAALVPAIGYAGALLLTQIRTSSHLSTAYRHVIFVEREKRLVSFDLIHQYKVGQCIALRTGLNPDDVENANAVLALDGECGP